MSGSRKRLRSPVVVARAASATVLRSSILLLALPENRPRNHSSSRRISGTQISSVTKPSFFVAASAATSAEKGTGSNIATIPATPREPFVDDGMFDPRRDYWGNFSRTVASGATTPAGSNWVAGEFREICTECQGTHLVLHVNRLALRLIPSVVHAVKQQRTFVRYLLAMHTSGTRSAPSRRSSYDGEKN